MITTKPVKPDQEQHLPDFFGIPEHLMDSPPDQPAGAEHQTGAVMAMSDPLPVLPDHMNLSCNPDQMELAMKW